MILTQQRMYALTTTETDRSVRYEAVAPCGCLVTWVGRPCGDGTSVAEPAEHDCPAEVTK